MVRRLLLLTIILLLSQITVGFSQITIGGVDTGPYGLGSGITVPINFTDNQSEFLPGNVFTLYLSDAMGNFVGNGTPIGTFSGFYTPFLNGTIPNGLAPSSNYKLQIKSTNPASTISIPDNIEIHNLTVTPITLTPNLSGNALGGDNFGWCPVNSGNGKSISLTSNATAPTTVKVTLKNLATGTTSDYTETPGLGFDITGVDVGFYSITATATTIINGVSIQSIKTYFLHNTNITINIQDIGKNTGCYSVSGPGAPVEYQITLINGIFNNYPGSLYIVNWGDGTAPETLTLKQIVDNSAKISHSYTKSSCNEPDIPGPPIISHSFKATITANNPICNVNSSTTAYAQVFENPTAVIAAPTIGCINKLIRFTNSSIGGTKSDCSTQMDYTWYVDGVKKRVSSSNAPFDWTFTTNGQHTVKLVASNEVGSCPPSEFTATICIQEPPKPAFDFTENSTPHCAPYTVKANDKSIVDAICNTNNTYNWLVKRSGVPALPSEVTFTNGINEPEFTFLKQGTYEVTLQINTETCGPVSTSPPQTIVIIDSTPVTNLAPAATLCGLGTFTYSNTATGPTRVQFSGTEVDAADTYTWTVTAEDGTALTSADYSFKDGARIIKYPTIEFKQYRTYKVSVTHKNSCGDITASQLITFKESPTPLISANAICYNAQATITGSISNTNYISYTWTTPTGGGTFQNANTLTPIYVPSPADRIAGKATVILTINTGIVGVCEFVSVSKEITIHPNNTGINSVKEICTGSSANQTLTSTVNGSTFSWTAININGNASGFSNSGTGDINEIITNNNATQNAVVVYTITPKANNCDGIPFTFTVTVTPKPIISTLVNNKTICHNNPTAITINSNIPTRFTWTSVATPGITGNTGFPTATTPTASINSYTINDALLNSTFLPGTVTYTIKSYSADGCEGNTITVTVTVDPAVTIADAGQDATICDTDSYALKGNEAKVGSGLWRLVSTHPITPVIAVPTDFETTVTGLVSGQVYTFEWAITGTGACGGTNDRVIITVTPKPVISPVTNKTICHNSPAAITLNSDIPARFTWTSVATPGITGNTGFPTATAPTTSANSYTINDALLNSTFLPGTVTYTIRSYSADGCEGNTITVIVTVDPAVTQADAGPDATICDTDSYNLKGNKPDVGSGLWRLVSIHPITPVIAVPTDFETTVTGLVAGQAYTFEWAITGTGACGGTNDRVIITVTPRPVISPVTNKTICHSSLTAITLNSDIPARFTWTSVASTGITGNTGFPTATTPTTSANSYTINDALLNSTFLPGTVTYTIRSYSADGCEGNTITVIVTVDPAVTQADAGQDVSICNTDSYNLKGNKPDVGTGIWTLVSASHGTPAIAVETDYETTVTGLEAGGIYTFKWTITGDGECASSNDEVTIKVNIPTVPGTTSGELTVCYDDNAGVITLSGNTGDVLRWQSSTDNGATWQDISGVNTGLTYAYTHLITTTLFRAVVQNSGCIIEYSTPTTITVAPATTIALAGADQILCNETSVQLKGNILANGETGVWTMVSGDANAVITPGSNSEATVNGLLPGITYNFKWTINGNAPCNPTEDLVTIRNNKPLDLNSLTSNAVVCNGQQVIIDGSIPIGGAENAQYNYIWESQINGGPWQVIAGETGENLNITLSTTGIISFRRTVNSGNCSSISNEFPITVQPPIAGNIIGTDQTICSGIRPTLITGGILTGGDGNFTYQWQSSPNGTTWTNISGFISPDYQPEILTETTYYRRIVSTIACSGALQSISNTVIKTVTPNAKAEFTWGPSDTSCYPYILPIQVVPYADRNDTYTWYANGDILASTGANFPGYTIETSGKSVTIRLVVTSKLGCLSDEMSHTFSTNQAVDASFDVSDTGDGCGPLTINLTNTSLLVPGARFEWYVGDQLISSNVHPPTLTLQPDPTGKDSTYVIKLKAITDCGFSLTPRSVLVRSAPKPIFSPSTTYGCSPLSVDFTNNSPLQSGVTYYFNFGDGTPPQRVDDRSTVNHPYLTTTNEKTYNATLTAISDCGTVTTEPYIIVVKPNTVVAELVVNGNQLRGCAPFTVTFDNNSTGATEFTVDFKDGSEPRKSYIFPEKFTHTFTAAGDYEVTLTATNGCSTKITKETITVLEQPKTDFEAETTLGCPGLVVEFKNKTQNGFSYVWDFGDGSTVSDEFEPVHTYSGNQEFYTVTLTSTNNLGCSMTETKTNFIHIVQPPEAAFNVNPSTLISIPNYTFNFEDESTNNPTIWEWDFGDGVGTSTLKNPSYTYLDTGTYVVTLKVINQQDCFTTTFKKVTIKGVPGSLFVPNSFIPGSEIPELRLFRAKGSGIKTWRFSVFNKWGQIIWETSLLDESRPAEAWDGTFKGQPMPQGVYYWKIDVEMINGTEWKGMTYDNTPPKRTGAIHLIR